MNIKLPDDPAGIHNLHQQIATMFERFGAPADPVTAIGYVHAFTPHPNPFTSSAQLSSHMAPPSLPYGMVYRCPQCSKEVPVTVSMHRIYEPQYMSAQWTGCDECYYRKFIERDEDVSPDDDPDTARGMQEMQSLLGRAARYVLLAYESQEYDVIDPDDTRVVAVFNEIRKLLGKPVSWTGDVA